ncbi:MAG: EAL domain-containing protein [Gammaproteobacteria bacterium]|nr:EAL domain-containing protein [Gammaproteobacteria bacterium]MBQ0839940.1 EAL domain-containing protein [Gammaproteobacteria bacterium]
MAEIITKTPLVLAVDDDVITRQLAQDMLTDQGFEIITAADGDSALALFKRASAEGRPVDVVLLDVEMPGKDGYEVCKLIRRLADGRNVPIIMISGREGADAAKRAYDVAATDFSNKPTNWLVLAQRLHYVMRASKAVNELKRNHQRLADAQNAAKLHYWEYDIEAGYFYFLRTTGSIDTFQKGQLQTVEELIRHTHPADRSRLEAFAKKITRRISPISSSIEHRVLDPKDKESFRVLLTQGHVDFSTQEFGSAPKRLIGISQDITDIRRTEDRIQRLAHFDELTGLYNRYSFKENLQTALELNQAADNKLAIFHIGIDGFKRINESFGHHIGDSVLQEFVQRLSGDLLANEIVDQGIGMKNMARLGGDECILMLTCNRKNPKLYASRVAERIKEKLATAFYIAAERKAGNGEDLEIFVSASIGIAMYPDDGQDEQTLLKNADTALHNAKDSGKNQYQFYNDLMSVTGKAHLELETELRRAIEHNQLELYYQPQVSASSGEVTGVEALVRWHHPQRGMVSPAEFIPLAEESGLILPMSDWIMTQACQQAKAWSDDGLPPFMVSINLSGIQFRQSNFEQIVEQIFIHTGVDPTRIGLELTESVVMGDAQNTIATLNALKELGVKLSIDDFGTGYSSLSYLQKFPLDTLKVDRSFIKDIGENSDDTAITEAIIAMGHSLGLEIIAEGVETQAQLDFLRARSCEIIQGFFFSRPLPASEIPAFVSAHRQHSSHLNTPAKNGAQDLFENENKPTSSA